MIEPPDPALPPSGQKPETLRAMCVWGEARGEPFEGKLAVAHVIQNREKRFNQNAHQVILKKYAFSCFLESDPNAKKMLRPLENGPPQAWVDSCAAVEAAASGAPDPTHGATHYCTLPLWAIDDSMRRRPRWHSQEEVGAGRTVEKARIGHHVFAVAP